MYASLSCGIQFQASFVRSLESITSPTCCRSWVPRLLSCKSETHVAPSWPYRLDTVMSSLRLHLQELRR